MEQPLLNKIGIFTLKRNYTRTRAWMWHSMDATIMATGTPQTSGTLVINLSCAINGLETVARTEDHWLFPSQAWKSNLNSKKKISSRLLADCGLNPGPWWLETHRGYVWVHAPNPNRRKRRRRHCGVTWEVLSPLLPFLGKHMCFLAMKVFSVALKLGFLVIHLGRDKI